MTGPVPNPMAASTSATSIHSQPQSNSEHPPESQPQASSSEAQGSNGHAVRPPALTHEKLQQIFDHFRSLDVQIQQLRAAANEAFQAGRTEDANRLREEAQQRAVMLAKSKNTVQKMIVAQHASVVNAAHSQGSGQNQNQNQGQGQNQNQNQIQSQNHKIAVANAPAAANGLVPHNASSNPQQATPSNNPPVMSAPMQHAIADAQAFARIMQSRGLQPQNLLSAGASQPGHQMPPQISPEITAQMQKLMEQQRAQQPQQNTPQRTGSQPIAPTGALQNMAPNIAGSGRMVNTPNKWHGMLSWAGKDTITQGRKEVKTAVVANATAGEM